MSDGASFSGSVPQHYDSKLGPLLFAPYAEDLARRLPAHAQRVLETAAGYAPTFGMLLDRGHPSWVFYGAALTLVMGVVSATLVGSRQRARMPAPAHA